MNLKDFLKKVSFDFSSMFASIMILDIPDDLLPKSGYSKEELLIDIAVLLYQRHQISLGRAALLSGKKPASISAYFGREEYCYPLRSRY